MTSKLRLLAILSVFVLVGAGCSLGGSGTSNAGATDGGIFKSTNGATTWAQTNTALSAKGVGSINAIDVQTLTFDPQDSKTIYLGTKENGVLYSYDAGASWQIPRDPQVQTGIIRSIAIDPKDQCTIYVVSGWHLFRSDNCGRDFSSVYDEARPNVPLRRVVVDWFNPTVVYLGESNGEILKSTDKGEHWSTITNTGNDISDFQISPSDSRILLIATTDGLFKSVDSGTTWTHLIDPFSKYADSGNIYSLVQDATGKTLFTSSKYGILKSTDMGESWTALNLVTSPGQVTVHAFAVDPTNTDVMYYGTASTFYKSSDGGATWETSKLPTSRAAGLLAIDPNNTSTLYMATLKLTQ